MLHHHSRSHSSSSHRESFVWLNHQLLFCLSDSLMEIYREERRCVSSLSGGEDGDGWLFECFEPSLSSSVCVWGSDLWTLCCGDSRLCTLGSFCKCWFKTPAKTVLVSRLYLIQVCTANLALRCRQDRSGGIDTELGADGELHTVGAGTTETSTSPANRDVGPEAWDGADSPLWSWTSDRRKTSCPLAWIGVILTLYSDTVYNWRVTGAGRCQLTLWKSWRGVLYWF